MYYRSRKTNFSYPDAFKFRFKRDPKFWTLEQVQDLWLRTEKRSSERRRMISEVYDKIINEIPTINNKKVVYFMREGRENLYKYEFSYHREYKCWGHSQSVVEFSKEKVRGRDEKIEFLLANSRAFELGQEFYEVKKYESKINYTVRSIFIEMMEDGLKSFYKGKLPNDISVVQVGDEKYYFAVDEQHRYDYLKFHFKGRVSDNIIKL